MPELPEVETIVRSLNSCIIGKNIESIEEFYKGTLRIVDRCIKRCLKTKRLFINANITKVCRRGKFIIIKLDNNLSIIIHLRMTGKLIFACKDNGEAKKHIRAKINFADKNVLLFNDPRTFGKIDVVSDEECDNKFALLGCEPLGDKLCTDYLMNSFAKRKISIKKALLNQDIVAGIGNIYANEILYRSKILPSRKVSGLNSKELTMIIKNTKQVLNEAIECNGTTISDYRRVDDKPGTFQEFLQVYGKNTCPRNHSVVRVKEGGRSSYFCPVCQK